MSTRGIGLLYLETYYWEQSVAFWQDLGFKVEFETDHRSGVLAAANGTLVAFSPSKASTTLSAPTSTLPSPTQQTVYPLVGELVREFTPTHWGTQVMTVRDRDGRLLRLEAPIVSESE